ETVDLSIGGVSGTGGIIDTTGAPSIGSVEAGGPLADDDNVEEGENLVFNVAITGTSTGATTYALVLGGGTATASADYDDVLTNDSFSHGVTYDAVTGLITVPAGVTGFSVTVPTLIDSVTGEPIEPVDLGIGGVSGTGGIIDTTGAPSIGSVEAGGPLADDDNVEEGENLVFNVAITGTSTGATTYALVLGGGTATASADYDDVLTNDSFSHGVTYDAVTGLITVPAGVTGFSVTVPTLIDSVTGEPIGTVDLSIGGVSGTGGIIDTTGAPSIGSVEAGGPLADDDNVEEGENLVFNVAITGTSTGATTYALVLGGGTATAGADYDDV